MPIIVKDFTWTQSESKICINLPLKGTKANNVDILQSREFIKVSYPPFLFECWFYERVNDDNSIAVVKNGIISLQFNKAEENTWPSLFHKDHENKDLLKLVREEAIKYAGEKAELIAKQKNDMKEANKKLALKEQMKLEDSERQRIESIKESERKKATEEIENLKKNKSQKNELPALENVISEQKFEKTEEISSKPVKKEIFDEVKDSSNETKEEDKLPAPRSSGSIQIKFTPRVFPTPSRESQDKLEREWLEKQAEARRITELPDDLKDLSSNETNLDLLKEKAGTYFKQENYQTAIGVYNHAIRLFPKEPSLYSNRAACHFKVRNLIKCVEDCTRALDLLTPPVQDNASSRLKAHIRRGNAFCELELYAEGLLDYEAALKIDPSNSDLKEDAENIRKTILGKQPMEDDDEKIIHLN
ncbi:unnamed protein product [Brachionus calyciflorus]|uniref:CS domain-containing protein n=1 Tax=Brachionus calyciflorus TaxID=104777 RepID=A0A813S4F7_9BILA|nr:unnamed protein product [Brachionus calyciflorus]